MHLGSVSGVSSRKLPRWCSFTTVVFLVITYGDFFRVIGFVISYKKKFAGIVMAAVTAVTMMIAFPAAALAVVLPAAPVMVQENQGVGDEASSSELGQEDGSVLPEGSADVSEGTEVGIYGRGLSAQSTIVERLDRIVFPAGSDGTTGLKFVLVVAAISGAWALVHTMSRLSSRSQLIHRKVQ